MIRHFALYSNVQGSISITIGMLPWHLEALSAWMLICLDIGGSIGKFLILFTMGRFGRRKLIQVIFIRDFPSR